MTETTTALEEFATSLADLAWETRAFEAADWSGHYSFGVSEPVDDLWKNDSLREALGTEAWENINDAARTRAVAYMADIDEEWIECAVGCSGDYIYDEFKIERPNNDSS